MPRPRVAVLGSTGFVGSAVVRALQARGAEVMPTRAPRLSGCTVKQAMDPAAGAEHLEVFREALVGAAAVVNAAGVADAAGSDTSAMMAANGALPGLLTRAAGAARLVHVSSAAAQGPVDVLDDRPASRGFSPYSRSKVVGEQVVLASRGPVVVYRPPGVHGANRGVTRTTAALARSSLATVASPGNRPTPQALVDNVADAIAFLALSDADPPPIVSHPWEGLSVAELLLLLGGRQPRMLPEGLAHGVVRMLTTGGRLSPALAATARRVDVLWLGQRQAPSWLTGAGWSPPQGRDAWVALGHQLRPRDRGDENT